MTRRNSSIPCSSGGPGLGSQDGHHRAVSSSSSSTALASAVVSSLHAQVVIVHRAGDREVEAQVAQGRRPRAHRSDAAGDAALIASKVAQASKQNCRVPCACSQRAACNDCVTA
jgi:hypothetical protein